MEETEYLKPVFLTERGLEKLNMELEFLCKVKRVEIAEALHETQDGGDTEDNTEYQSVLYQQLLMEQRISELQRMISAAQLIAPGGGDGIVRLGSTVTIEDEEEMRPETYLIVGSAEADPSEGRISNECPLGLALMGRSAGDRVDVPAPDGAARYRILAVG